MTTFPVTASTIATCASSATAGAVRAVVWAGTAAELLPVVLTAVRHAEDSEAAFLCRQVNAAEPLGLTFEQCALKSLRHAERSAFVCPLVDCRNAAFVCSDGGTAAAGGVSLGAARAGAEPAPTALTAVRHAEDREAAFLCRQVNAAEPLGLTFEQCAMKSFRHAERRAFACPLVGC